MQSKVMASFGSVGEFVIYEQIYNSSNFATLFSPVAVLKQGCYLGIDRERKHLFPLLLEIPLKIWFSCVSSPPLVSLFCFNCSFMDQRCIIQGYACIIQTTKNRPAVIVHRLYQGSFVRSVSPMPGHVCAHQQNST